jgi:hypothetical protein
LGAADLTFLAPLCHGIGRSVYTWTTALDVDLAIALDLAA